MKEIKNVDEMKLGYLYRIQHDLGTTHGFDYCFITTDSDYSESDNKYFDIEIVKINNTTLNDLEGHEIIDYVDFDYSKIYEIGKPELYPEYLI